MIAELPTSEQSNDADSNTGKYSSAKRSNMRGLDLKGLLSRCEDHTDSS